MGSGFLLFEYLNAWKMLIPLAPLRFYLDLGSPPDWDPGRDPAHSGGVFRRLRKVQLVQGEGGGHLARTRVCFPPIFFLRPL